MKGHDDKAEIELRRRRNETYAKWVKEVALLSLAALVVQNLVAGATLYNPMVIGGMAASLLMYYRAYCLIEEV